jgi:hypothetical protein
MLVYQRVIPMAQVQFGPTIPKNNAIKCHKPIWHVPFRKIGIAFVWVGPMP